MKCKRIISEICAVLVCAVYIPVSFALDAVYDFLKELLSEKELAVNYEDEALCRRSAWVQCGMGGMNLPS